MNLRTWFVLLAGVGSASAEVREYWVYKPTNLAVDKNVEECAALFQRAAKAGYTHCLIADSKFSRLGDLPDHYFKNAEKVKTAAAAAKLELVPALFSIGYSNDLLFHDPNLIEGPPVKDLPMVVKSGMAVLEPDPALIIRGGDFSEGVKGWSWRDECITFEDGVAVARDPKGKNARLSQKVRLQPWRQYHISVRVQTKDFRGTPEVKLLAGNHTLNFDYLKVAKSQDWTQHHVVFNSQENTEANLYLGCWDGTTGELRWDDARIEEVAFVNLIRRAGAPLVVKTADGKTLKEGTDFEPLSDPLLGTKPYNGCYTVYHQPPMLKSNLPDGTKLLVSYFHGVTVHDDQASICPSEPRTLDILRDQAQRMHALWKAKGYMMSHDEIRVWNWCQACQSRHLDAGGLLADNVKTCLKILREVNPGGRIYVWSDMFDPNHNARGDYYLVQGSYRDSWLGLDRDVIIVPWYFEKRNESLKFFADRGHRQVMAGYYDGAPEPNAQGWMTAAKSAPSVEAIMYTTWNADYSKLETFIQAAKAAR